MARLLLSKATLAKQRQQLGAYRRFLPSLDLKRQQLQQSVKQTAAACLQHQRQLQQMIDGVGQALPMLANQRVDLDGLCKVSGVELQTVNVAGVKIQTLAHLQVELADIALLGKPHWVLAVQTRMQAVLQLQVELQLLEAQLRQLQLALRKVTQRVNLFEKVLIPQTLANIKRIRIYLDDRAREAVITSKIAKSRQPEVEAE